MSWTTYSIDKGCTDWKPIDGFKFINRFSDIDIIVKPNSTLIFDYSYLINGEKYLDKDWMDWKKIGGISLASWRYFHNLFVKNNDAIMLGWRWNPVLEMLEFCVYENKGGKNIPHEAPSQILRIPMEVESNKVFFKIRRITKRRYEVYLWKEGQTWMDVNPIVIAPRSRFTMYSKIGMYYGGENNAPGPWGGAAPKDMWLEVFFE